MRGRSRKIAREVEEDCAEGRGRLPEQRHP
jgi:hypothetical protein